MASYHCLTFLTDYGLEDGFVAACRGVALQIAPLAPVIDITHLVPPGDIRRGAALLEQTVPYLPTAVHVAVVDPGVGTARRGIAVEAASGSVFVGPDNGLLSWAVEASGGPVTAVSLTNTALWLDSAAATFHGRDIFMPVAAHLASGVPLPDAGEALAAGSLVALDRPGSRVTPEGAEGEVLLADRFGNVQLSITASALRPIMTAAATRVRIRWAGQEACVPFGRTFGDVPPGELIVYPDSSGRVAIAVNGGSAADRLGLRPGAPVTLTPEVLRKGDHRCLYPLVSGVRMAPLTGI